VSSIGKVGIAALSVLISSATPAAGADQPGPVGLLGRLEARVARQLRRELTASGFQVVKVDDTSADPPWLVTMDPEQTRVLLLVGASGFDDRRPRASFAVDLRDDVSIRRVALALVERLRLESTGGGPPAPTGKAAPRAAAAPSSVPSPVPAASTTLAAPAPPQTAGPPQRPRPWALAAATTLDVPAGAERPMGHVQIVGETPLGASLVGRVRVLWPLLGRTERLPDRAVRLWTMGAAFGLRLPLHRRPQARLQPFLAAATGLRFVLSDTDFFEQRHGGVGLTPALAATASAGLRVALAPLVQAVLELGNEWSRTVPSFAPAPYERQAADARALRAALGVSFDY
jgi:hypothetical protein